MTRTPPTGVGDDVEATDIGRRLERERAARNLARQIFLDGGMEGPAASVSVAVDRILALLETEISAERDRCVQLCRARGELWKRASSPGVRGLEENRARANEALYLADLLAVGDDRTKG
jgi:hypothetical protein